MKQIVAFEISEAQAYLLDRAEWAEPKLAYRFEEMLYSVIREWAETADLGDDASALLDDLYGEMHSRHERVPCPRLKSHWGTMPRF